MKRALAVLAVAAMLGGLAWLLMRQFVLGLRSREAAAQHLVKQLSQAAKNYETDWREYPPGCGEGSAELAKALLGGRRRCFVYPPGILDERGDIVNPAGGIFHYHNNRSSPCSHARNRASFDIWGQDAAGRPDGINNWE